MKPSVGSIVLYRIHAGDADQINQRRTDAGSFAYRNRDTASEPGTFPGRSGHISHSGNPVTEGDLLPAIVVRTFSRTVSLDTKTVNLKVLLDGNDDFWATSRGYGQAPGQWSWPVPPQREPGDRPAGY